MWQLIHPVHTAHKKFEVRASTRSFFEVRLRAWAELDADAAAQRRRSSFHTRWLVLVEKWLPACEAKSPACAGA